MPKYKLFSIIVILTITACNKPKYGTLSGGSVSISNGVFINNEGNYGWGNASVSYYDLKTGEVTPDIYKQVNNLPLGDVCQSITYYNDKYYIVVNNSNKIEIVNSLTFKSVASIHNLVSPRYLLPVSNNKAYISDMYENKISVLNLSSNVLTKKINCPGSTEEMLLFRNKVFVTNTGNRYLYIVDTLNDNLNDSIMVGASPYSIQIDNNSKLWVLCAGNPNPGVVFGTLYKINPLNSQVEKIFNFMNVLNLWNKLRINRSKDTLYYINNGVFQLPVNSGNLPQSPLIPQKSNNYYGLGIEPDNGNIFVSDAIDYVQPGKIYIYESKNGVLIKSFIAGIIPGDFLFN